MQGWGRAGGDVYVRVAELSAREPGQGSLQGPREGPRNGRGQLQGLSQAERSRSKLGVYNRQTSVFLLERLCPQRAV